MGGIIFDLFPNMIFKLFPLVKIIYFIIILRPGMFPKNLCLYTILKLFSCTFEACKRMKWIEIIIMYIPLQKKNVEKIKKYFLF